MLRLPRRSTLFPYTTLFRSSEEGSRTIQSVAIDAEDALDELISTCGFSSVKLASGEMVWEQANPLNSLSLQTLPGPILYKFLRSEEHTSELQSQSNLVCRLL